MRKLAEHRSLQGNVVVVTGASSGIGRATALKLAERGARLVLVARREEALEDPFRRCRNAGGEAICLALDVDVARTRLRSLARLPRPRLMER